MITTNRILWAVFLALLAVLLPHTAWLFQQFEPATMQGQFVGWVGAFSFEAAIAVLTHKLARRIEATPRRLNAWRTFAYRYLNAYSLGLIVAVLVSALANLGHAVEYGRPLAIFDAWGIPPKVYQLAFGAVLPVVSLLFARVLSNVQEIEQERTDELEIARSEIRDLRKQLKDSEQDVRQAEHSVQLAEQRFGAAGDLLVKLFAEEKRERILAAAQMWPELPRRSIALMVDSSPSYVSDVLSEGG